jgi:hypothetical protein
MGFLIRKSGHYYLGLTLATQKPKLIFKTTAARRVKERNPDF